MRGFRAKWSSRQKSFEVPDIDPLLELDDQEASEHFNSDLSELKFDDDPDSLKGDSHKQGIPDSVVGSKAEPNDGGTCSKSDAETMTTNAFIRNVNWSSLELPWETDFMKPIFGNSSLPEPKLALPNQWNATVVTSGMVTPEVAVPAVSSTAVFVKHVKQIRDETFMQQREKNSSHAIAKWILFLGCNLNASQVGQQISVADDPPEEIVHAVLGVKSPNTSLKRANSMLSYHRWHVIRFDTSPIPFQENCCWIYLRHLQEIGAPASRAVSFVQAVRFSHFVFQVDGALSVINSRRIVGLADIQLSLKKSTRQARPLTVDEVCRLHQIASSPEFTLVDRVIASHFLLMIYGRCRSSDTTSVESVTHDNDSKSGYVEVRTRQHKSSKAAIMKSLLLPIVIPCFGIAEPSWVQSWWENRIEARSCRSRES